MPDGPPRKMRAESRVTSSTHQAPSSCSPITGSRIGRWSTCTAGSSGSGSLTASNRSSACDAKMASAAAPSTSRSPSPRKASIRSRSTFKVSIASCETLPSRSRSSSWDSSDVTWLARAGAVANSAGSRSKKRLITTGSSASTSDKDRSESSVSWLVCMRGGLPAGHRKDPAGCPRSDGSDDATAATGSRGGESRARAAAPRNEPVVGAAPRRAGAPGRAAAAAARYRRAMGTMKIARIPEANGRFEVVDVDIPEPGSGQVRVKVHACGVCHSDSLTVMGAMGNDFPRAPGHEVAGEIDAVGDGVSAWSAGDRVGVGWFGGCCFTCEPCRRGDFISCQNGQVPGISYDGGYAEYMVAPAEALARIPDDLSDADAAPLLCAGITTFNALRKSVARPGDLVAILGVGGLGHLGIQYAVKMGFEVVAIARGGEKGPLAKELGAHHYIDSTTSDVGEELTKRGGAQVVLATVTVPDAMTPALGGSSREGSSSSSARPPTR